MTIKSDVRTRVIALAKEGRGRNFIANELKLSQGSVSNILKEWKSSENFDVSASANTELCRAPDATSLAHKVAAPENQVVHKIADSSITVQSLTITLQTKNNSQVEYKQRILTRIVAYAIIVYQYIGNLSNNFSSCCEASDIN